MVLRYTADNGYTGILKDGKELSIYNREGKEVLHTYKSAFSSYSELVERVETFDDFLNMIHSD